MPNMNMKKGESLVENYSNHKSFNSSDEQLANETCSTGTSLQSQISVGSLPNDDLYDLYQYFMNIAILAAKKRKNKKNQAGACVVNSKNKVVGIGNNTEHHTMKDELLNWLTSTPKCEYLNHAEANAIINKTEATLDGCTIFSTQFPCMECAKLIIQSGIRNLVYISNDDIESSSPSRCQKLTDKEIESIRVLLKLANVTITHLE